MRFVTGAIAVVLTVPLLAAAPAEAKTAFQYWAQGQGVYASSVDRLSTWQDDLVPLGWGVPPEARYGTYHRYHQPEYGYGEPDY